MVKYIDRKNLKKIKQDIDKFLAEDGNRFFVSVSPGGDAMAIFGNRLHGFTPKEIRDRSVVKDDGP